MVQQLKNKNTNSKRYMHLIFTAFSYNSEDTNTTLVFTDGWMDKDVL